MDKLHRLETLGWQDMCQKEIIRESFTVVEDYDGGPYVDTNRKYFPERDRNTLEFYTPEIREPYYHNKYEIDDGFCCADLIGLTEADFDDWYREWDGWDLKIS